MKTGIWLGTLSVLSLVLLVIPSPREWGAFGRSFSQGYDRISHVFQPAVHLVLMGAVAYALMHLFASIAWNRAVAYSLMITVGFTVGLEVTQSYLPASFGRSCDPYDLIPSLVGALFGCGAGLVSTRRSRK